jgi:hypothetical protein
MLPKRPSSHMAGVVAIALLVLAIATMAFARP